MKASALALLVLAAALPATSRAQEEGPAPTELIVNVTGSGAVSPSALSAEVDGKKTELTALTRIPSAGAEIDLLIDDGLRTSVGRNLDDIRNFIKALPQGTAVFIGYMQNGRVAPAQNTTTDLAAAASNLRIPFGAAGLSASPYICVSDFVKHLPSEPAVYGASSTPGHKPRFILMLTNGVDPYNGSVSPLNQNSPYVDAATTDAQRAGIPVYAIYFADAGIGGGLANFSGQNYLAQIAERTGGQSLYNGRINPVSLLPYLKQFQTAIAESYIASFITPPRKGNVVSARIRSAEKSLKVRATQGVRPGTVFSGAGAPSSGR